ncbi:MAG: T9SS type A sorting domain-containing protein [bacterium]|nr:T9SS type A sorting domain-containing protein [bacterium]
MNLHLKTLGKLTAIAVMLFTSPSLLKGQMIGWPAALPSQDFPSGGGIVEMDQVRAKATGVISGATNITFTNAVGTFSIGDYVLIIQMEGINNGMHEMRYINSIISPTLFTISAPVSSNPYNTADVVQIVKVPVYDEVFLASGDEITCSPYNSVNGTGGILTFIANDIRFQTGGYFNVSAKGFEYNLSGIGTGGTGAIASSIYGGGGAGGMPVVTNYPTYCPPLILATPGTGGGQGDPGDNLGNNGTTTTGTLTTHSNSSLYNIIAMGDCGDAGIKGGKGGGAGGHGGIGGQSNSICSGGSALQGAVGSNGEIGGDAAKGGRGAGIMLIKIHNGISYTSTPNNKLRFIANGENGAPGLCPNIGGFGGAGGVGTPGCCSGSDYANGNYGGFGGPGNGAGGGDGGSGGEHGTIWLKFKTSVPGTLIAGNFAVNGGKGGAGGLGAKAYETNYISTNPWPFCTTPTYCPPSPAQPRHFCDCDKAFQLLSKTSGSSFSSSGTTFIGTGISSEYNTTDITLVSYDGSDYYHCNLYNKTICDDIFAKMTGPVLPTIYPLGEDVSLTTATQFLGDNTWYSTTSSTKMFNYLNTNKYLIDYTDPARQKCYIAPCFETDGYTEVPGLKGPNGANGDSPPNGTIDLAATGGSTAGAAVDCPSLAPQLNVIGPEVGLLGAQLYPVPTNGILYMDWSVDGEAIISITDLSGKTLITKTCDSDCDNMATLNVSSLSPGVYLMNITINKITQTLKFQKN